MPQYTILAEEVRQPAAYLHLSQALAAARFKLQQLLQACRVPPSCSCGPLLQLAKATLGDGLSRWRLPHGEAWDATGHDANLYQAHGVVPNQSLQCSHLLHESGRSCTKLVVVSSQLLLAEATLGDGLSKWRLRWEQQHKDKPWFLVLKAWFIMDLTWRQLWKQAVTVTTYDKGCQSPVAWMVGKAADVLDACGMHTSDAVSVLQ